MQAYVLRDEQLKEIGILEFSRASSKPHVDGEPSSFSSDREEIRTQAALLDGANDAIFLTALDGCISYWNKGAERLYGWSAAEAIGQDERALLRARYPLPYEELFNLLLQEGHWEGEVTRHRRGGEPLTVSSRWSLIRDADGSPFREWSSIPT